MYLSQIEEQISINFLEFNDAPPNNAPFTSGISKIDAAFRLFTLPPYNILMVFFLVPNILLRVLRIYACTSAISSKLAVFHEPIAKTGSYAIIILS